MIFRDIGLPLRRGHLIGTLVAAIALGPAIASAQFNGAIYTTKGDGTNVNFNIYNQKSDVYLNGGPQNANGAGLPDGYYYFQVTDPSGATLLSTDPAANRILQVVNGVVAGHALTGNHANGLLNPANGSQGVQLIPFADTPNGGGEYQVTLIMKNQYTTVDTDGIHLTFRQKDSKSDNFKIGHGGTTSQTFTISGRKFYDANMNGIDDGEPGVTGVKIRILTKAPTATTWTTTDVYTGAGGVFQLPNPVVDGTHFQAFELLSGKWMQTAPAVDNTSNTRQYDGFVNGANVTGLLFGNIATTCIWGCKFYDHNMDGIAGTGDQGVPGFTINVNVTFPNGDTATGTATTDANGKYHLGPFPAGSTYNLSEVIPPRWYQTAAPLPGTIPSNLTLDGNGDVDVSFLLAPVTGQRFGNIAFGPIGGSKFYDSNANGVLDSGEPGITGYHIFVHAVWPNGFVDDRISITGVNGAWKELGYPDGTTYTVTEIMPPGNWVRSYPASGSYSGTTSGTGPVDVNFQTTDVTGVDFYNFLLGHGGGLTKGFWSNKNGMKKMLTQGDTLSFLQGLNLRNADGSNYDPPSLTDFQSWLNNATAVNMANMLSAQLAAMELNVKFGYVDGNILIYAPGAAGANTLGYMTVNALMAEANTELGLHGVDGSFRNYQQALKNALDAGNNDQNVYVQAPVTVVNY